jgi:menaquinone-dependent protoporphyrinogen IX oxidase
MNHRILVTYVSKSSSTVEIAETIGQTLKQNNCQVDIQPTRNVKDVKGYDAVLVGGPIIKGWHQGAMNFVEHHAETLSQIPVAYFFTSLNLTRTSEDHIGTTSLYFDPSHGAAPKNSDKLNFKEKHTSPNGYYEKVAPFPPADTEI